MFRKFQNNSENVTIYFEGESLQVESENTVASALLSKGYLYFKKSLISGKPRAPFCMMGVCFECLLEIDGESSQQACLIRVRDGMKISRQKN